MVTVDYISVLKQLPQSCLFYNIYQILHTDVDYTDKRFDFDAHIEECISSDDAPDNQISENT